MRDKGSPNNLETLGKRGLGCLISLCLPPAVSCSVASPSPEPELDSAFSSSFLSFFGAGFSSFACASGPDLGSGLAPLDSSGPRLAGTWMEARSSPSSANIAITCPTGIFDEPASA